MADPWSPDEILYATYSPENIVFVVDLDAEVGAPLNGSAGQSRLDALKEGLKSFIHIKSRLNPQHKIGLVTVRDGLEWRCPLTTDASRLCTAVTGLYPSARPYPQFNLAWLSSLLDVQTVEEDWQRGVVTRYVLVYCRSNVIPECVLPPTVEAAGGCPSLRLDLLYLHDKPVSGVNCPQRVYDELIKHMDEWGFQLDFNPFIFEAPASKSAPQNLKKFMAYLLSHPLQRCHQEQLLKHPLEVTRIAMPQEGPM